LSFFRICNVILVRKKNSIEKISEYCLSHHHAGLFDQARRTETMLVFPIELAADHSQLTCLETIRLVFVKVRFQQVTVNELDSMLAKASDLLTGFDP